MMQGLHCIHHQFVGSKGSVKSRRAGVVTPSWQLKSLRTQCHAIWKESQPLTTSVSERKLDEVVGKLERGNLRYVNAVSPRADVETESALSSAVQICRPCVILPDLEDSLTKHSARLQAPGFSRSFMLRMIAGGYVSVRVQLVVLKGLGNNSSDYDTLVSDLAARNVSATVLEVSRLDWLRNAAGLLDSNYWRGTLSPRPVLNWYLDRLRKAIDVAKAGVSSDGRVSLLGHSAGGWLARVYLTEFGTADVGLLVTLGTPHLPPPRGVPGVFDQTRDCSTTLKMHAPEHIMPRRYLKGRPFREEKSPSVASTGVGTVDLERILKEDESAVDPRQAAIALEEDVSPTFRERFVGAGYKQVCGRADVWGDGVVPEESAYLEGAINISFEGVYHSPVGSNAQRPWYGTPEILDQWVDYLLAHT